MGSDDEVEDSIDVELVLAMRRTVTKKSLLSMGIASDALAIFSSLKESNPLQLSTKRQMPAGKQLQALTGVSGEKGVQYDVSVTLPTSRGASKAAKPAAELLSPKDVSDLADVEDEEDEDEDEKIEQKPTRARRSRARPKPSTVPARAGRQTRAMGSRPASTNYEEPDSPSNTSTPSPRVLRSQPERVPKRLRPAVEESESDESSESDGQDPMMNVSADEEDKSTPGQRLRRSTRATATNRRVAVKHLRQVESGDDEPDNASIENVEWPSTRTKRRAARKMWLESQAAGTQKISDCEESSDERSDDSEEKDTVEEEDAGLPPNPYMPSQDETPRTESVRFHELNSAVRAYIHTIALTFLGYDGKLLIGRGFPPHQLSEDQALVRAAFHKVEDDHIGSTLIAKIASGDWGKLGLQHRKRDRFDLQRQLETHPTLVSDCVASDDDHIIPGSQCVACNRELHAAGFLVLRNGSAKYNPGDYWNTGVAVMLSEKEEGLGNAEPASAGEPVNTVNLISDDDDDDDEKGEDNSSTTMSNGDEFHPNIRFPVGPQCFERVEIFHRLLHFRRWVTSAVEQAVSEANLNQSMAISTALEEIDLDRVHREVTNKLQECSKECDVIDKRMKSYRRRKSDPDHFDKIV